MKRIQAPIIAGLLLLMLLLPQLTLADGPQITKVDAVDITATTATITWSVNTSSTITENRVFYGTTVPLGQTAYDTHNVTNPSIVLTGLTPGAKYYFEVEATDVSGTTTDDNAGLYYYFTTSPAYSITLEPVCGVCGELVDVKTCQEVIEVTATVAAAGTYYICWNTKAAWDEDKLTGVVETIKASVAGSYKRTFFLPVAKKGPHDVYLTDAAYNEKAKAPFVVHPSATIYPEYGPVGTIVTINVYGYDANKDVQVVFMQGGIQKGDPKPGKTHATLGSWKVEYTIPDTPSGGYTFEIQSIQSKEGIHLWVPWVSKHFTVTPEITVTPDSGTVGQKVKVEGTGFASEEEDIEVTFDGEVRKENIYADEDGSWDVIITIPPRHSGSYAIDASGTFTRARDVNDVEFVVGAGILVEPSLAYVGETITVSGGGFRPVETGIKVSFGGQVRATVAAADISGCWEASFELPPNPYGANTVSAQGDITAPVTNTLTVKAKIEGISPTEGSPGDSISLTGSGFSANKKLTVTIGGVSATVTDSTRSNGDVVISFRVPKGVTIGKQTLKVTDEGGATDSVDFTVKEKVLPTPLPVSPDDSTIRSGIVTFEWQGITSDSDFTYTYTLQISKTAGFTSIFRSGSVIEELSIQIPKEYPLPKGTYYWRVKAVDDYGNESPWSDSIKFTASPIPPWVWVVVGLVVLVVLMVVAYRETKFKVTE